MKNQFLNESEFSQQMKIRDIVSDLCAEIESIDEAEKRQQAIDYAIQQLTDLKAEEI